MTEARIWSFKKTPRGDWYWQHTDLEGNTVSSRYFASAALCFDDACENGWMVAAPRAGE